MHEHHTTDAEPSEPENLDDSVFAKAEAAFRRHGTLAGMSIRVDGLSGGLRLSMGEDCEDGMATFHRLESAKRRGEDE